MNKAILDYPLKTLIIAALFAATPSVAPAQGWTPERQVEIVVGCTPGCGPDTMMRLTQRLFQVHRLVDVPVSIQNKSGGVMVRTYLKQFEGNGHYLHPNDQGMLSAHAIGRSAYTDLAPIAMLFGEHIGIAVKADSPIKSGRDLIERLRKDPLAFSVGVPSIGSAQHQSVAIALRAAGVDNRKVRTVAFNSGALSRTALLGGHIDVVPATLGSLDPDVKTGALRVIAVASAERVAGAYASIPTWREQGANSVVFIWRAMFGPKGMAPPQIAYWESAFQRLTQTPEWQSEMAKRSSVTDYMSAAALRKRMDEEYPAVKAVMVELELAKK